MEEPVSEHGTVVDVIVAHLDGLAKDLPTRGRMAKDAMSDLLKFTFNLLIHYPKVRAIVIRPRPSLTSHQVADRENEIVSAAATATASSDKNEVEKAMDGPWHDNLNPCVSTTIPTESH